MFEKVEKVERVEGVEKVEGVERVGVVVASDSNPARLWFHICAVPLGLEMSLYTSYSI